MTSNNAVKSNAKGNASTIDSKQAIFELISLVQQATNLFHDELDRIAANMQEIEALKEEIKAAKRRDVLIKEYLGINKYKDFYFWAQKQPKE